MRKSESVVRISGSGNVSVIRTKQASARLMGVSAYFCKSLSTDSRSLARLKATMVVGVAAAQQSDEEARVNEDVSGHTRSPSYSASFERSDRPAGCRRNRSN